MYLMSVYFDEKTNNHIQEYINDVAKRCGNTFMVDHAVPPHITVSAFETKNIQQVIAQLEANATSLQGGLIDWVTVGQFFPSVIYMAPVLGETLHGLAVFVHDIIRIVDGVTFSKCYQPLSWFPHATIGKTLTQEEMLQAFESLQHKFAPFSGEVVRIELAKKNPYSVLWSLSLKR